MLGLLQLAFQNISTTPPAQATDSAENENKSGVFFSQSGNYCPSPKIVRQKMPEFSPA
jgi:hypothetical protein